MVFAGFREGSTEFLDTYYYRLPLLPNAGLFVERCLSGLLTVDTCLVDAGTVDVFISTTQV